jgi:hypothetical protein
VVLEVSGEPKPTAACVTAVLKAAGFKAAKTTGSPPRFSAGFTAVDLPMGLEPYRVAVMWHHSSPGPHSTWDRPDPKLMALVPALRKAGYKTERVVETASDYLVAWTEGDF